jgi:PadR family transcriptional regulator PadR
MGQRLLWSRGRPLLLSMVRLGRDTIFQNPVPTYIVLRMGTYLRVTPALRAVLECLMATEDEVWGLQISGSTGRPTGTIYPLLERLERAGFLDSRWEADSDRPGPRRRLYRLIPAGREWAAEQLGRNTQRAVKEPQ